MPITLYMTPLSPPARAVILTAEVLGIKLELKHVDLAKQEQLKPEFMKLNPQHTVPLLDDNGTYIWDSHAIIAYLVRKYGKNDELYPKDFVARAIVDQRLHFESGVVFSLIRQIVRDCLYKGKKSLNDDDRKNILEVYGFMEAFLTGRKWAAGDSVTIADFSLLSSITSMDYFVKIDEQQFPNVARWIKQAEQLSYYKVHVPGLKEFGTFVNSLLK